MRNQATATGGVAPLFCRDWSPEIRRLIVQLAASGQAQKHHRARYDQALAELQSLAKRCDGIACPRVKEAGLALAKAPRGQIQAPFTAFADALLARSREPLDAAEERAVELLANQAMWQMKELALEVNAELEAQREAMTLKAQAARLLEVEKKGTGGIH